MGQAGARIRKKEEKIKRGGGGYLCSKGTKRERTGVGDVMGTQFSDHTVSYLKTFKVVLTAAI